MAVAGSPAGLQMMSNVFLAVSVASSFQYGDAVNANGGVAA